MFDKSAVIMAIFDDQSHVTMRISDIPYPEIAGYGILSELLINPSSRPTTSKTFEQLVMNGRFNPLGETRKRWTATKIDTAIERVWADTIVRIDISGDTIHFAYLTRQDTWKFGEHGWEEEPHEVFFTRAMSEPTIPLTIDTITDFMDERALWLGGYEQSQLMAVATTVCFHA